MTVTSAPTVRAAASVSGATPSAAGSMPTARSASIARNIQMEDSVRDCVAGNQLPGTERDNIVGVRVNKGNNGEEC